MKVKEWINYNDTEGMEISVGGMGGFFKDGMRWKDYIEIYKDEYKKYPEAIRLSVIENNLRITGQQHQYSDMGTPVFEDGTIGSFSFRAWGDLMAAIWSEYEDKDYNYMDFYM